MNQQTLQKVLEPVLRAQDLEQATDEQQKKLLNYVQLLQKWGRVHNLTTVLETGEILSKHIADSLMASSYIQGKAVVDVGTGAGLPGIPLAIMNPEKTFFLVERLQKKINFLQSVVISLGLKNVQVIHGRIQQFTPEACPDVVISRAVATIENFVSWVSHICDEQTQIIAMKGRKSTIDAENFQNRDFAINDIVEVSVPGLTAERCLVFLKKTPI